MPKQNKMIQPSSHWILLRGLARESRHWGDFPEILTKEVAAERPGEIVRVDCLDLPGTGRYSEMRSPLSITRIAEFMRDKFIELRRNQREQGLASAPEFYLVALSLGGMVACRWMEMWPRDFAGCVLINTSFREFSPTNHRLRPLAVLRLMSIAAAHNDLHKRERRVLQMVSNKPEVRSHVVGKWAEIEATRPVSPENVARQLIAAAGFKPRLVQPPVPVLLLNSKKDRMVDPRCSEEIARRWQSDIESHPWAGHDLTLDDPHWAAAKISKWYHSRPG